MKAILAALVLAAAVACAPFERSEASPEPATVAMRTGPAAASRTRDPLVAYLSELRAMNEAALAREVARQRTLSAKDGNDLSRTRLALALSMAQGDDAEIVALTEPVARKESAAPDVRAMASFLHAMAVERRRLKESAAAANTKLREERRAVEAQKQRADTMQERAAQLQQKLDALTELEKSLSDRPSPNR